MRVLVIDDNQQITRMLSKVLEIEGIECTVSNDGKKGLEQIEKNQFDAILLDLAMPKFSGHDILEELEKKNKIKDNKIIVFTATSLSDEDLKALIKKGIHSCLIKPIDPDVLLEKIFSKQNE